MGRHHNRPDLVNPKATFVYFARAYPSGLIKIGYSYQPNTRAHALAWEHGEGVSVLFTVPGTHVQERGFHKRFSAYRSHGEWFHEAGTLHDYLKEKGHHASKVIIKKQVVHLPSPTGNAICTAVSPDTAAWIAERLNLAAKMEAQGWQPIDTAPRDGTDILLGCATWARAELGQWSPQTGAWFTDGGSYEDGEVANGPDEVDSPTHWQPLPRNPLT